MRIIGEVCCVQAEWKDDGGTTPLTMQVEDTLVGARSLVAQLSAAGGTVAQVDLKVIGVQG